MKVVLDKGAFMPERAYELDAGYDIRTPIDFTIPPASDMGDGWIRIDSGVHVQIPRGYAGFIKSKSGLNIRCITTEGVIDSGYTGSIGVILFNHGSEWKHFDRGDKICQLVLLSITTPELELVEALEETERGDSGFGSTGR